MKTSHAAHLGRIFWACYAPPACESCTVLCQTTDSVALLRLEARANAEQCDETSRLMFLLFGLVW